MKGVGVGHGVRQGMRQKWPDASLELEFVNCSNLTLPTCSLIFYSTTHTEQYERHKKKNQVQVTRQAQQNLFTVRGLTMKVVPCAGDHLTQRPTTLSSVLVSQKIVKSLSVCKKQKSEWTTTFRNLNLHF